MRVHVDPSSKEILGYYPESIEYENLPADLVDVSDEDYEHALEIGATHWNGSPEVVDVVVTIPTPEEQANAALESFLSVPINTALIEVLEAELPTHDLKTSLRNHLVTVLTAKPWGSDVTYMIGDMVTHNGFTWIATSNNTGNEPDDVPGDWSKI